ncbi:MAG: hypothetical protein QNJ54_17415 [Prochloraceae cyanobacterium]|nr:hypothetical protein [Prochloraceae cyanobacterium]
MSRKTLGVLKQLSVISYQLSVISYQVSLMDLKGDILPIEVGDFRSHSQLTTVRRSLTTVNKHQGRIN